MKKFLLVLAWIVLWPMVIFDSRYLILPYEAGRSGQVLRHLEDGQLHWVDPQVDEWDKISAAFLSTWERLRDEERAACVKANGCKARPAAPPVIFGYTATSCNNSAVIKEEIVFTRAR